MTTTYNVTITNTGSAPITVIGRNSFSIPAHTESSFILPSDQQTRSLLARLRRDHPLLQISEVASDGTPESVSTGQGATDSCGQICTRQTSAPAAVTTG